MGIRIYKKVMAKRSATMLLDTKARGDDKSRRPSKLFTNQIEDNEKSTLPPTLPAREGGLNRISEPQLRTISNKTVKYGAIMKIAVARRACNQN
jgi:hypothetical protein